MEEDGRTFLVNLSNKRVIDKRLSFSHSKNSIRSSKIHKDGLDRSFFSHLQKTLIERGSNFKITDHKDSAKVLFQKELRQDYLLKSKQHLEELSLRTKVECLFLPQAVQEFLKECFLLHLNNGPLLVSQICGFFDSLVGYLNFASNENSTLLRFFSLNDKILISTNIWQMEITLSNSGKIENVKISTSDKDFFDKCSKTASKLKSIMHEYDWLDEVDFIVSFEMKTQTEESKTLKYKVCGFSSKTLNYTETFEEGSLEELNLSI
jgi:hypothetical protein